MSKLFGTDGIRGVANVDLTCDLALKTAVAAAGVLVKHMHKKPKILIGQDTRASGDMLACAMAAGFTSAGADVVLIGVVPTPAVAYLVREMSADAGVMISASHNPAKYNGIKIFSGDGYKLPDAIEDEIEALILDNDVKPSEDIIPGCVIKDENAVNLYIDYLVSCADSDLKGFKIILDTANGSASVTAEKVFKALGAEVITYHNKPDGLNINKNCGSTHINEISDLVKENGADIGIAFDGDADRCLAVDQDGREIDGDKIIAYLALYMKSRGELNKNRVVVTVLSNMGFIKTLKGRGIEAICAKVGDRYVLEEMKKDSLSIGGEQSGHVILLDKNTTGDGQITAIMLLCALKEFKDKSSSICDIFTPYPQVQLNVRAQNDEKEFLENDKEFIMAVKEAGRLLNDNGRVLVRPSGTEPKVRVMVEGSDLTLVEKIANDLAQLAEKRIAAYR